MVHYSTNLWYIIECIVQGASNESNGIRAETLVEDIDKEDIVGLIKRNRKRMLQAKYTIRVYELSVESEIIAPWCAQQRQ